MQNLPITITAAPPVNSVQSSASADHNNSTAQATEPFGNVLARQRASTGAPQDGKQNSKQGTPSSTNNATAPAIGKDSTDIQPSVPDVASVVPGDVLAALLPASTSKSATNDKTDPQAPSPDGVSTLPGDMLAMLLPSAVVKSGSAPVATNEKNIQEITSGGGKKTQPQKIETAASGSGEIRQPAKSKMPLQFPEVSEDSRSAPSNTQKAGKSGDAASGISAGKDKAFAAALEASSKDSAKAAQLGTGLTKAQIQPDKPDALEGLLQSGAAPMVAQNGAVQAAAQAVINTPVTHEAWGDEFNQKITWMATQNEQTAELHLNPPNLGPLDVVLSVSGDQATALFTSPHAAVRDAIEQALPRLRDMMADNGIMLGNAMVSDQSPKDQQAWQADQRQKRDGRASGMDAGVVTGTMSPGITAPARRHQGMVDTFV